MALSEPRASSPKKRGPQTRAADLHAPSDWNCACEGFATHAATEDQSDRVLGPGSDMMRSRKSTVLTHASLGVMRACLSRHDLPARAQRLGSATQCSSLSDDDVIDSAWYSAAALSSLCFWGWCSRLTVIGGYALESAVRRGRCAEVVRNERGPRGVARLAMDTIAGLQYDVCRGGDGADSIRWTEV